MKTYEELQSFIKEFTGINPETPEQYKEAFLAKFFTEKDVKKPGSPILAIATGFLTGKISNEIKKRAALERDEIDGKSIEEIIELAFNKQAAEKEELKKQITDPQEGLKDLQAQLEKAKIKIDEEKQLRLELKKALEEKDKEYTAKEINRKKTEVFEDVLSKLKKGEEGKRKPLIALSEEQEFFLRNKLKDSFEIDFEEDKPILTDKTGKKISHPNKAGEFLEPLDAFYQIAEEKKYIQNNAGGKVDPVVLDINKNKDNNQQPANQRPLPAGMMEHVEHLKSLTQGK